MSHKYVHVSHKVWERARAPSRSCTILFLSAITFWPSTLWCCSLVALLLKGYFSRNKFALQVMKILLILMGMGGGGGGEVFLPWGSGQTGGSGCCLFPPDGI